MFVGLHFAKESSSVAQMMGQSTIAAAAAAAAAAGRLHFECRHKAFLKSTLKPS